MDPTEAVIADAEEIVEAEAARRLQEKLLEASAMSERAWTRLMGQS